MPFVRQKMRTSKKGKKNGPYLEEVESVRDGDKVKQVFIKYLGQSQGVGRVTTGADGKDLKKPYFKVHNIRINPEASLQWVSKTAEGNETGLLAKAKLPNGKTEYYYNQRHWKEQNQKKYDRIRKFKRDRPEVLSKLRKKSNSKNQKESESGDVLLIVNDTSMRIGGGKTKGKIKTYGATTLETRHIKVTKKGVTIEYVGKKGVMQKKVVKDQYLAAKLKIRKTAAIKNAKKNKKNPDKAQIFPNATEQSSISLLREISPKNEKYKNHDFRTFNATSLALEKCKKRGVQKGKKNIQKAKFKVADEVAATLGNTRTATINSYIDPIVWGNLGE